MSSFVIFAIILCVIVCVLMCLGKLKISSIGFITTLCVCAISGTTYTSLQTTKSNSNKQSAYTKQIMLNNPDIIYTNSDLVFTTDVNNVLELEIVQDMIEEGYTEATGSGFIAEADDISNCTDKDKMAAKEFLQIYNDYKEKAGDKMPPMWMVCGQLFTESRTGMDKWGVMLPLSELAINYEVYDGTSVTLHNYHSSGDGAFQLTNGAGQTSANTCQLDYNTADKTVFADAFGLYCNYIIDSSVPTVGKYFDTSEKDYTFLAASQAYNRGPTGFLYRYPLAEADALEAYRNTYKRLVTDPSITNDFPNTYGALSASHSEIMNYYMNNNWTLFNQPNNTSPTALNWYTNENVTCPQTPKELPWNGYCGKGDGTYADDFFNPNTTWYSGGVGDSVLTQGIMGYESGDHCILISEICNLEYNVKMYVAGKKLEANVLALCGISNANY